MKRKTVRVSKTANPGDSICYTCAHWDWEISFPALRRSLSPSEWENRCKHPDKLQADDAMKVCTGFQKTED